MSDVIRVTAGGALQASVQPTITGTPIPGNKFNPGFVHDAAASQDAFLVQRCDETVGVVLLRRDGETADVLLDYVTPRYRDFSPGEFVWRRSGLLSCRGIHRVVTPPGMVGAYYDRLGFRREGESYVLDVA